MRTLMIAGREIQFEEVEIEGERPFHYGSVCLLLCKSHLGTERVKFELCRLTV